jgi:hypothetical protein
MRFGDLSAREKKAAVERVTPVIASLSVGDTIAIRGRKFNRVARVSRVNDRGMRFIEIWSNERRAWTAERRLYPVDLIY